MEGSPFCYNCGIRLTGDFCGNCGQKAQHLDPTFSHLLHELTHEFLHVDGKIFKSVWTLLAKPGVLTRDYFDGRRARWISPIRLYLVFSIVWFFIASLESGISERWSKSASYLMFLMLPVFAWLVGLMVRSKQRYPRHLYFALHVHAAWFAAFAIMELARLGLAHIFNSTRVVGWVTVGYALAYPVVGFHTAYRERFIWAALKMTLVLAVYSVVGLGWIAAAALLMRR